MAMCSETNSLARLSITARAAGWGEDGVRMQDSPGTLGLILLRLHSSANTHPQGQMILRGVVELSWGRTVPGSWDGGDAPCSSYLCAHHLSASTCPGGPGRSLRRGCPRGPGPAAPGACRCSQGTACCRRTWLSAPSSGWGLQRRSRGTVGSHGGTGCWVLSQPCRPGQPRCARLHPVGAALLPGQPSSLLMNRGLLQASTIMQQGFLMGLGAIFSPAHCW